jgi:RNA polymerase sigma factor (sigma-70 family)
MKVTNRSIRFDDLLTPDIYERLFSLAQRFAAKSLEGLEAEDLVQEAIARVMKTYKGRTQDIKDLGPMLTEAMTNIYRNWLKREKPWHLRKEMLTDFFDPVDENGSPNEGGVMMPESLTSPSGEAHTILALDVERAIARLTPKQQYILHLYRQTDGGDLNPHDYSLEQLAHLLGGGAPGNAATWRGKRRIDPILKRLRQFLADYAPQSPGKRPTDSHQDDAA